ITGYTGAGGRLVIPATIFGVPVTGIGEEAFTKKEVKQDGFRSYTTYLGVGLTSVIIPDSVTSIGERAFYIWPVKDVNQLTSVVIGNKVTSIGERAFFGNRLTSVVIPDSVTSIGQSAFSENRLTSVVIGNSVTYIDERAFSGNQLTSVVIPNSVRGISNHVFSENQLTSVVIGNSVTRIGGGAFANNRLTSVVIGNNVTIGILDYEAFFSRDSKGKLVSSGFEAFYKKNKKKAGTYTRPNANSQKWTWKP
ncbi:MAG: leucine-rich repeat domain-containing protein, partial [Treponema sp.]|nr:leucine-rich repeat domain-containing protein [Treponema sp.]